MAIRSGTADREDRLGVEAVDQEALQLMEREREAGRGEQCGGGVDALRAPIQMEGVRVIGTQHRGGGAASRRSPGWRSCRSPYAAIA